MLFTIPHILPEEEAVLERVDEIRKGLSYLTATPLRWYGLLRRSALARNIRGSNSIEGFNVTEEDALAVVDGHDPIEAGGETLAAIKGYQTAMTYVLQLSNDPHFSYGEGFLRSLHYMMLDYDMTKNPGKWRPGHVFVRDEQKNEIVYEGPDAEKVPKMMLELVDSLNSKNEGVHTVVRAAMSHLNLVMIHPFSDGNGRMARCLQTLVLAREGILDPRFCSIEEYLGQNTLNYYSVLGEVGAGSWHPERDARPWVRFCLTAHYHQAQTFARRAREMSRAWDEIENELKLRGLPDRMVAPIADAAFQRRIRNSSYRSLADVSELVASRDLKQLVQFGLLIPTGERRGRFYTASPLIQAIRERAREPKMRDDPFQQPTLPF